MPFKPTADCDDCLARIHDRLDGREAPANDAFIRSHIEICESCRDVLEDWQAIGPAIASTQLQAVFDSTQPESISVKFSTIRFAPWGIAAVAACWMCIGFFGPLDSVEEPGLTNAYLSLSAEPELLDFHEFGEQVRQPDWWGSVATASWRPVAPIAAGIRPLTNSFQTALELLTPRIPKESGHQPVEKNDVSAGVGGNSIYA